jgi:hypothetical protein
MHRWISHAFAIVVFGVALSRAQASTADLNHWFLNATQFEASVTAHAIAQPDFLGGTSMRAQCGFTYNGHLPAIHYGVWQLLKYDRTHHIGLAAATTDQCSAAVFRASTPAVAVPDGDLSKYSTGRGLHIGSTYAQVLALYGPPAKQGQHFVTVYTADVPDTTESLPKKPVKLPEVITIVIDDGHVSSITVYVDESGLF